MIGNLINRKLALRYISLFWNHFVLLKLPLNQSLPINDQFVPNFKEQANHFSSFFAKQYFFGSLKPIVLHLTWSPMHQIPKFHVQSLTLRDFKGRNSAQYISNLMLMITYQSVCCKPVVHLSYNFRSISSTKSPLVRGRNLVLPQFTSRPKKKKKN